MTAQSDRDAVVTALHDEIAGGPATGLAPTEDDGTLMVAFVSCTVVSTSSQVIDASVLHSVFLQVDAGNIDFCFHDFNFLDSAGKPVKP